MTDSKRIVQITYALATFIVLMTLVQAYASIFAVAGVRDTQLLGKDFTTSRLLAIATAGAHLLWTWRHPRLRPLTEEVADEMTRVTWPTWDETRNNVRVTIVVSVIAALILAFFDSIFGAVTNFILGGGG